MIRRLLIAAALVLSATAAHAENLPGFTGEDWYKSCTSSNGTNKGYCYGYTLAVADTVTFMEKAENTLNGGEVKLVCFPNVPVDTLVDIGKVWYRDNPTQRHWGAVGMLANAFKGAFPCGDKS